MAIYTFVIATTTQQKKSQHVYNYCRFFQEKEVSRKNDSMFTIVIQALEVVYFFAQTYKCRFHDRPHL